MTNIKPGSGDVDDETIYALVRSFDRGSVPEDVDRVRALLAQQAAAKDAEIERLTAEVEKWTSNALDRQAKWMEALAQVERVRALLLDFDDVATYAGATKCQQDCARDWAIQLRAALRGEGA